MQIENESSDDSNRGARSGCARNYARTRIDRPARGGRGGLVVGLALSALLAAGCSFVEVTKEAEAVGVVQTMAEASQCREIGEINSNTTSRVGFIARNETKVAVELERLARNSAAKLGANTLVPGGPVTAEGSRRYVAFYCGEEGGEEGGDWGAD